MTMMMTAVLDMDEAHVNAFVDNDVIPFLRTEIERRAKEDNIPEGMAWIAYNEIIQTSPLGSTKAVCKDFIKFLKVKDTKTSGPEFRDVMDKTEAIEFVADAWRRYVLKMMTGA